MNKSAMLAFLAAILFPCMTIAGGIFPDEPRATPYGVFSLDRLTADYHFGNDHTADVSLLGLRMGIRTSPFLELGGRFSWVLLGGDTVYIEEARTVLGPAPGDYRVEVGSMLGAYVKVFPFRWYVEPFVVGGINLCSADFSNRYNQFDKDESGFMLGTGFEIEFSKVKLIVEKAVYADGEGWDLDGVTVGLMFFPSGKKYYGRQSRGFNAGHIGYPKDLDLAPPPWKKHTHMFPTEPQHK